MSHGDWKDMFRAVQNKDVELIMFYIRQGIDVNYQHPEFLTSPLIESIRLGYLDIAKLLLQNGALPILKEAESNKTPGQIAFELKNKEALQLINDFIEAKK